MPYDEKEYQNKYREKNKENIREYKKIYRKKNYKKITEHKHNYYQKNREKILKNGKEYYKKNIRKIKESQKKYRKEYPEVFRKNNKKYYEKHSEKTKERQRKYRETHREKERIRHRKYNEKYKKEHLQERREYENKRKNILRVNIGNRMSCAICVALKGNKSGRHWETLVGYTMEQFKQHFQSLFIKGMNWTKFINGEIHIDHVVPKSYFHYESTDDPQFKQCWALYNLQPMWKKDNLSKGNRNYQLPLMLNNGE